MCGNNARESEERAVVVEDEVKVSNGARLDQLHHHRAGASSEISLGAHDATGCLFSCAGVGVDQRRRRCFSDADLFDFKWWDSVRVFSNTVLAQYVLWAVRSDSLTIEQLHTTGWTPTTPPRDRLSPSYRSGVQAMKPQRLQD